jgi:hypothetical protein
MNRQQLKYFLELDPERRRRALAQLLVTYLKIFETVKGDKFDDQMESIREQIMKVNTEPARPKVEGLNECLVKGEDLIKLLSLDETIADMVWELKITHDKLRELINQLVEEISTLETTA